MSSYPFLPADLDALKEELVLVETHYNRALGQARESGPIRSIDEQASFHSSHGDAGAWQCQLAHLRSILERAVVVDPPVRNDVVAVGSRIRLVGLTGSRSWDVQDTVELGSYYLTGTASSPGRISSSSPLGQKLLGRRAGDVLGDVGPQRQTYKILAILPASTRQLVSSI